MASLRLFGTETHIDTATDMLVTRAGNNITPLPDDIEAKIWDCVREEPWYHMIKARLKGRMYKKVWDEHIDKICTWFKGDYHRRLRGDFSDIAKKLGIDIDADP
jgi:hypothetical protein